jgi:hypothetical protein
VTYRDPEDPRSAAAKRAHYERNKERYLTQAREQRKQFRLEARVRIEQEKSKPCADCGSRYPYWVMDFDHLGHEPKVAGIGKLGKFHSMAKLEAEIAKCEVVCSNCHRQRTRDRSTSPAIGTPRVG